MMRLRSVRAAAALLAAVLVGEATVAALSAADAICRDDCAGEGSREDCPPFCGDCGCCADCFRPTGVLAVVVVRPAAAAVRPAHRMGHDEEPASAEPGDILVVPRAS